MHGYSFVKPLAAMAVATALFAPAISAAALLYDNGPLVSHPGAGLGGADASAVQEALGMNTFGFGYQVGAGNRLADDFTVPAGGWNISTITFFGYQTNSTTTSTFTSANLRIWDGPPDQPGSNVVFGDTTTNRLSSTAFSSVYRVLEANLLDGARPVMTTVVTVNTSLPAGTYWLDWQAGGSLASGPWAPPVTIAGQTGKVGANALQFTSSGGAWAPVIDTGSAASPQDFPFLIETADAPDISVNPSSLSSTQVAGTTTSQILTIGNSGTAALNWSVAEEPAPGTCSTPADVPWLSASPASGVTAVDATSEVTLSFNASGLTAGTYQANLCITSDDPDAGPGDGTGLVVVPVQLTVTAAPLPVQAIPTLGELSLSILGLALAGLGAGALRRRKG